ncbi:MAG: RluA family pseudouridine synthase [Ruminococcaceae bacterium]|nr:RluA family pseudouridine synthase [Oscillospiraceae bacterium]
MAELLSAVAESALAGVRLDRFLADRFSLTRSTAERLIEAEHVTVSGRTVAKNYRLRGGEEISLRLPDPTPAEASPENIPLDIVYEDEDIVVVNKPAGMVVHPAAGNESGTLVNALLYHCKGSLSGIGGVERPGIVHRIDKDTAGLLVVAKNDAAHTALSADLKVHDVRRVYHAIALGNFKEDEGTVNAPIGRHPTDRKKMAVCRRAGEGREAITHYRVLERFGGMTYLCCELETGRTHQIRVHMASLGHPLLGDPVYGGNGTKFEAKHRALFCGQHLFAGELSLTHPRTGERMHFKAPLPPDFEEVLRILRKEYET